MGSWPANSIRDRGSELPQKSGYTRAILTFLASRIGGLANRGVHICSKPAAAQAPKRAGLPWQMTECPTGSSEDPPCRRTSSGRRGGAGNHIRSNVTSMSSGRGTMPLATTLAPFVDHGGHIATQISSRVNLRGVLPSFCLSASTMVSTSGSGSPTRAATQNAPNFSGASPTGSASASTIRLRTSGSAARP